MIIYFSSREVTGNLDRISFRRIVRDKTLLKWV